MKKKELHVSIKAYIYLVVNQEVSLPLVVIYMNINN